MSSSSRERILTGIKGLEEIRSASLILFILWLVALIIAIIAYSTLLTGLFMVPFMYRTSPGWGGGPPSNYPAIPPLTGIAIGLLVAIAIVSLVIIILGFYAVYGKLVPGASKLAYYSSEYSTASSLIKIGFIGGLITVLIAVLALFGVAVSIGFIVLAVILLIVAFILFLLGRIGLIVLCFKLNSEFEEGTILAAGIIFIISIFLSIDFVGWILLYVGLGSVIKKLRRKLEELETGPTPEETSVGGPIL
jgi:hypothetical protein